tara:strand:+ start:23931 stop:24677 length:747 start_codon:yes stop_codon:yes gene_type:complete
MNLVSNYNDVLYEKIQYDLLIDGYSIIKDFLREDNQLFIDLLKLHNSTKVNNDKNYPGGALKIFNNVNKSNPSNGSNLLYEFVSAPIIKKVAKDFFKTNNYSINVFQTLDTDKSSHIAQSPHFDRIPTLKFVLYMNDLITENGAFHLSPGSHIWVKKNFPLPRPKHSDENYLKKTREICQSSLEKIIPIHGKAGQLLIFHTDCIHHQGIVNRGECKIFRAHFRSNNEYLTKDQNRLLLSVKNLFFKNK